MDPDGVKMNPEALKPDPDGLRPENGRDKGYNCPFSPRIEIVF
jgi:hypothetical protein